MQQQHFSPASPPPADPPMTYDEASMQGSRHFFMALQELKNLRPQLYSAAEYCESSYLFNDQKQVVLENLKDYTVKALVNAVDHLGTVAYKLDEVLAQQVSEFSAAELQVAGLSQRIQACQEDRNVEGFSQQRSVKVNRRYHKLYLLPDESGKSLSWNSAIDPLSPRKGVHPMPQAAGRVASVGSAVDSPISEHKGSVHPVEHAGPSSSQAGITLPASHSEYRGNSQASSMDSSKQMTSHPSFDEKVDASRGPPATRSKSLLFSILGRHRSGKMRGGQS